MWSYGFITMRPFLLCGLMYVSQCGAISRFIIFCISGIFSILGGALSIGLTTDYFIVARWMRHSIDRYHEDNFSAPEDFPYTFARRVMYLPVVFFLVTWVQFFADSRWLKFGLDMLFSFVNILFLCVILHPQKALKPEAIGEVTDEMEHKAEDQMKQVIEHENAGDAEVTAEVVTPALNTEEVEEVRRQLFDMLLEGYLNPHLTKSHVVDRFVYGKKTVAKQIIQDYGFYNLVNMLRLRHAQLYQEANPEAIQDDIACSSGFTSRYSYSRARTAVAVAIPELVERVRL